MTSLFIPKTDSKNKKDPNSRLSDQSNHSIVSEGYLQHKTSSNKNKNSSRLRYKSATTLSEQVDKSTSDSLDIQKSNRTTSQTSPILEGNNKKYNRKLTKSNSSISLSENLNLYFKKTGSCHNLDFSHLNWSWSFCIKKKLFD